jgi:translocation and assembly module TamB
MSKLRTLAIALAAGIALVAGSAFWVLARGNLAADFVAKKAVEIARERMGAELSLEGASGNPIMGFHFGRAALAYRGKPVLSAGDLSVSFKLLSLFGSNPALEALSLSGLQMDLEQAADFLKQFEGSGASRLEVNRLLVNGGALRTRFGEVKLSKLEASIAGNRYQAGFEAETRGVPFSGRVRLDHDGARTVLEKLEVAVRKGKASFSGAVRPGLDLKGTLEGLDLADVLAFWPKSGKPGDFKGTVSGPLTFTGTWEAPKIQGNLKLSGAQLWGFSTEAAEAKLTVESKDLRLDGLSGKAGEGTFAGNLEMSLAKSPAAVKGTLSVKGISVEAFRGRFPELEGVGGKVDVPRVSFSGNLGNLRLQGNLESPALSFKGDVLERVKAQVALSEKRVLALNGNGVWMAGPVRFDGTVALEKTPVLALSVKASSISLERLSNRFSGLKDLAGKGSLQADLTVSGPLKAPQIRGQVASDLLTAKGETFQALRAGFTLSGDTVSVTSLSARWNQALLSGKGTIGQIRSETPVLNFSGTASGIETGAFASRVKDLETMQLSGTGAADWKISGTAKDLSFDVTFASQRLETPEIRLSGVKADAKGRIQEKAVAVPLEIRFSAEAAAWGKARVDGLSGRLSRAKDKIEIPDFSARLAGGQVKGSGTMVPGKEKEPARLDFKADATGIGMQTLSLWAGLKEPVQGKADLSVTVGGTTRDPLVGVSASIPSLQAAGLKLADVRLKGTGKPSEMTFDPVSAAVGGGSVNATGRLSSKEGAPLTLEFSVKGTDLDLKTLASGMQAAKEAPPSGKIDLSLKGTFSERRVSGSGELVSKGSIRFLGITLSELRVPLSLEKGRILATGVSGSAYGGGLEGNLALGEGKKWTGRFSLSGADLDAYLKEQMKLEGRVTGRFDLDFQGGGTLGVENSTEGSGVFSAKNGEVSGFRYVKAISALYGRSSIRYRVLDAPYKVQGERLVLSDGKAEAFEGDPLYEYVDFDGTVGPKKALALNVRGRVNIQALNALVGGVRGGVLQAGKSVQEILQGFLQGVTGAMSARDIRMVRGRVVGTTDKPSLTDLRIEGASLQPPSLQPSEGENPPPAADGKPDLQDAIQQEILKRIFNPSP